MSANSPQTVKSCPICRRPAVVRYRPFCSKRCADIDLNRWLKGAYVISGHADAEEDGDTPETQGPHEPSPVGEPPGSD